MAKVTYISVGADGTVWCADDLDRLWRLGTGTSWARVVGDVGKPHERPGSGKVVAVRNKDEAWCNSDAQLVYLAKDVWKYDPVGKEVQTIAVAEDGTVAWGNSAGELFWRKPGGDWQPVVGDVGTADERPGSGKVVAVRNKDEVWCNEDALLVYLEKGVWKHDPVGKEVQTIAVAKDGTVAWGNSADELFWRKPGGNWQPIVGKLGTNDNTPTKGKVVAVRNQDELWCVNQAGEVWQLVKGQLKKFAPPKGVWKYTVKQGDKLYRILEAEFKITYADAMKLAPSVTIVPKEQKNKKRDVDNIYAGDELTFNY
jgi:hypothetical protein